MGKVMEEVKFNSYVYTLGYTLQLSQIRKIKI